MAVLACAVAPVRDTTGHDWYAEYKLTVAELLIGVGFDEDTPVEYRNAVGEVGSVSRFGLTHTFEARWARKDVLEAAWNGATLGALSGFGGALVCFVLLWRTMDDRRGRRPANEAAPGRRCETRERPVPTQESPASGSAPARNGSATSPLPATAVATLAPANRLPISETPPPANPKPAIARQGRPDRGKDNEAESAPREPRDRDYGRWV